MTVGGTEVIDGHLCDVSSVLTWLYGCLVCSSKTHKRKHFQATGSLGNLRLVLRKAVLIYKSNKVCG